MTDFDCRSLLVALCLAAAATTVSADERTAQDELEGGFEHYRRFRYADALASFTKAAHDGNVRAQELAGLMNWLGTELYGAAIGTDRGAAMRWFRLAAAGGSELGTRMTGRPARRPLAAASH